MKWDVIRDVQYKYSKKAQDRFFSYLLETYFFVRFCLDGIDSLLDKEDMTQDKRPRV